MCSLFLDRDGVINKRIHDGYVLKPDDFVILDGVLEAMAIFASKFDHIFIVTNQQCIGKGLLSEQGLEEIHNCLVEKVVSSGGRIDRIYHCPALKSEHSFQRKPSIGMALRAHKDFPDVVLRHSVMVGDTVSDMLFGRRARMTTVLVGDEEQTALRFPHLVDFQYESLWHYAQSLVK